MSAVAKAMPRGLVGVVLTTLVMLAALIALGVWQLHRKDEKRALIVALTQRLATEPVPLPARDVWPSLTAGKDEFRRVQLTATLDASKDAMVYSSGSGIRADVQGPGTWTFVPARLANGGTVVVNLGFVQNTMQDRTQQDRAVAPFASAGPLALTGYLRFPETPGLLTPAQNPVKRLWFARDTEAMAKALGWSDASGSLAPFYVDLEAPVPPSGAPKPGPLSIQLRDNHLQYAITWFGLAAAVSIAFGFWVAGQRRAAG